jgi:ubiquitin carboxyl-terminal hydrolase 5/13
VLHNKTSNHPLVLNIQRTRKKVKVKHLDIALAETGCALVKATLRDLDAVNVFVQRDEPPQKIKKLAIGPETEADRYDTTTRVECYECGIKEVDRSHGKLPAIIDGVLKANTFARQAEVQAWEQEMTPCEHTLCMEQGTARKIDSQGASRQGLVEIAC